MLRLTPVEAAVLLEDGRREIEQLVGEMSDADAERTATIGGGDWSVKDLIGHIAHWEELALETVGRALTEGPLTRAGLEDVDAENAKDVERKAGW
ncbi:MAG: ClbS/DfsB family four-helix bundle protein, partial [Actinomycetota bacterium]|nr:ClbS/DfsB family four-helix bundle protein [Actinomycetota bacterium]